MLIGKDISKSSNFYDSVREVFDRAGRGKPIDHPICKLNISMIEFCNQENVDVFTTGVEDGLGWVQTAGMEAQQGESYFYAQQPIGNGTEIGEGVVIYAYSDKGQNDKSLLKQDLEEAFKSFRQEANVQESQIIWVSPSITAE